MPSIVRIGELVVPVTLDRLVEMTSEKRRLRGHKPLPPEVTQDNLKINFNSEEYRDDLVNIAFLGHLQYDILIPYPNNASMTSIFPDGIFTEVWSINYYQKINGDCELTHAIEDLYRILKVGGTAYVGVPNFDLILGKITGTSNDQERLKWEHFLFSRNVDEKGLYYNQSICTYARIHNRASYAGFRSISEDTTYGKDQEKFLTMEPDAFDLPGIDDKAREEFKKMLEDTGIRRKKCIVPRCECKAGQKEFRREQSVYCRRHYRKAKVKLQEAQERALRSMIVLKKE